MKIKFLLTNLLLLTALCNVSAQVSFDRADLKTNKKYSCLLIDGVWEPGRIYKGLFLSEKQIISDLTTKLTNETNSKKKRKIQASINAATTRKARANKNYCGKLQVASLATVRSLSDLPNTSKIVVAGGTNSLAVSGTPPALASFSSTALKNVFWNSGVIDAINTNSASPQQCSEMYSGRNDGESGGFEACYAASDNAYTLSDLVASGTTLCYMRNIPSSANVASGTLNLVSGSFPSNDPSLLFATPSGSTSRLIEIRPVSPGEEESSRIFINVKSNSENAAAGNQFAYTYHSCEGSGATPSDMEEASVTSSNQYIMTTKTGGTNRFEATVRAYLAETDGVIGFDSTRDKTIQLVSQHESTLFKGEMTITPSNYITAKRYFVSGSMVDKTYSVSRFSATSISTLRLFESAFHRASSRNSGASFEETISAVEYRDTNYKVSTSNPFLPWTGAVDFNVDSFYLSAPSSPSFSTTFNCNTATPDVVVSVDMSSPTMTTIRNSCEADRFGGANFCQSDSDLTNASNNYTSACPGH